MNREILFKAKRTDNGEWVDCKWKGKRHQKCSCCIRNISMKDCYEGA